MDKRNCRKPKVVYCDPEYIYCDTYRKEEIIFVHPIKRINREHIQYVPRHVYEEENFNEVIDPGVPDSCKGNNCSHNRRRRSR
ncbi:hypothetical protein [Priestia koreensis]|uniref:hypothetical protein n=1 Tax=Priestia koreensis TaxID=284581 RepID=UPI00345B2BB4